MSFNEVAGFFCYLVTLLLFAFSAIQKWRDHLAYERSVESFAILPPGWITPMAWLSTLVESLSVVLLLGGLFWPVLQPIGLLLVLLLLLLFTGALVSVLVRGLQVSCGCFGTNEHLVSSTSLVRNVGLIVCCAGSFLYSSAAHSVGQGSLLDVLVTTLASATFVLLWTNLDEIATLLRPKAVGNSHGERRKV